MSWCSTPLFPKTLKGSAAHQKRLQETIVKLHMPPASWHPGGRPRIGPLTLITACSQCTVRPTIDYKNPQASKFRVLRCLCSLRTPGKGKWTALDSDDAVVALCIMAQPCSCRTCLSSRCGRFGHPKLCRIPRSDGTPIDKPLGAQAPG